MSFSTKKDIIFCACQQFGVISIALTGSLAFRPDLLHGVEKRSMRQEAARRSASSLPSLTDGRLPSGGMTKSMWAQFGRRRERTIGAAARALTCLRSMPFTETRQQQAELAIPLT
jgi:hypothetical protein